MTNIINKEEIEGRIAVTEAAISDLKANSDKIDESYMRSLVNARDYWKNYLKTYYN